MMPNIHLSAVAIIAAIVAQFILGFLWYGPLFGKVWMRELGKPADYKPNSGDMTRAMVIQLISSFLVAFVMSHSLNVWRPSVWMAGPDGSAAGYGFMSGFFTWIGFFVPLLLAGVAYEGKSWKLFGINASYYFVSLQAVGMIIAFWG